MRRQAHAPNRSPHGEHRGVPRRLLAWIAGASVGVMALGWGALQLLDASAFPVRTIRVTNALQYLDAAQLRSQVAPYAEAGFLRVNVEAVRRALEAMPWVEQARVRRAWPDALEIRISERRPAARWNDRALVDAQGHLFAPPEAQWPTGLPHLNGPAQSAPAVVGRLEEFQQLLAPVGLKAVALTEDERRSWTLLLDNGIKVLLGTAGAQKARFGRFVQLYPRVLAARAKEIVRVDLRYTNGFAVAWRAKPAAAGA